jgi:hypothetical protein
VATYIPKTCQTLFLDWAPGSQHFQIGWPLSGQVSEMASIWPMCGQLFPSTCAASQAAHNARRIALPGPRSVQEKLPGTSRSP